MPRRKLDQYYTPKWASELVLSYLELEDTDVIYEPCCGAEYRIAKALHADGFKHVFFNDLDSAVKAHRNVDAEQFIDKFPTNPDWIITNPPFSDAHRILLSAYKRAEKGVALLLRLSFLEPTFERQQFLSNYPPDRLIVLPRISFTDDGHTDSVTCAWMVWFKPKYKEQFEPWTAIQVIPKFER